MTNTSKNNETGRHSSVSSNSVEIYDSWKPGKTHTNARKHHALSCMTQHLQNAHSSARTTTVASELFAAIVHQFCFNLFVTLSLARLFASFCSSCFRSCASERSPAFCRRPFKRYSLASLDAPTTRWHLWHTGIKPRTTHGM